MKKKIIGIVLIFTLALTACGGEKDSKKEAKTIEIIAEPEKKEYELTFSAVGDNLIHRQILTRGKQADGSYDFSEMYANVKEVISSYDLSVVNQETIYVEDKANVSSYPCFGSPTEVGDAIIDAGFDVVLSATNHTWDKGETGVRDSLKYWKSHPDITLLGINENREEFKTVDIVSKNNIDMAMFNYTYGLNGFSLPAEKTFLVNLLDYKDKFIQDVEEVEDKVDFTICFLHIGVEYVYAPTDFQVDYINDLIDAGADLVICAHPHVIEPYRMVTTEKGNSALVYYSCGNFISGQDTAATMLGGMASLKLKKTVQGEKVSCTIEDYDFIPLVTHWNRSVHTVYFLEDYTEDLASQHALRGKGVTVEYLNNLWKDVTSDDNTN